MVDVDKLSKLARIMLEPSEKDKLQKEFEAILGYISKLKSADLTTITPMSDEDVFKVLREDNEAREKGEFTKKLLEEAPSVEGGYIKVKHVFD